MRPAVLPAAVVALLLAVALSACGGGAAGSGGGGKAKGKGKGAFPVTITHRYGTTVVKKRPVRVVTVGRTDQDVAIALGVLPVGVRRWFGDYPSAAWPWTQPELAEADPPVIGDASLIDLAAVKARHPDVILAMDPDVTRVEYRELSKIAPVIGEPLPAPAGTPAWAPPTRLAGRALGLQAQASAAIFAAKHDFTVVKAKHPGFSGTSMVVAARDDTGTITIYGPADPRTQFLTQMGFTVPPWVTEQAGDATSFTLRPADAGKVAAKRITWIATAAQKRAIKADPVVAEMPVTQTGRTVFLPQDEPPVGDALTFDTLRSIRYAVDWAVPLLGPPPAPVKAK